MGLENIQSSTQDIWIIDLIRGISSRFTFRRSGNMGSAVWSPDGTRIVYSTIGKLDSDVFIKEVGGSNREQLLLDGKGEQWADDWSPDGRYLLFETFVDQKNLFDLRVVTMTGEKKQLAVVEGEFNQTHASFSPDGKWIAYVSDESGKAEVYVQGFMNLQAGKYQISTAGGDMPLWSKDGNELFYLAPGGNLMVVEVKTNPILEAGTPQVLFKTAIMETGNTSFRNQYLPSADGTRFSLTKSNRARRMNFR